MSGTSGQVRRRKAWNAPAVAPEPRKKTEESLYTPARTSTARTAAVVVVIGLLLLTVFMAFLHFIIPDTSTDIPLDAPYDVVDIPGRGKGAVAIRDIEAGELLIREAPLFRLPAEVKGPVPLLRRAMKTLTTKQQNAYFALSHHVDPEAGKSQTYYRDRMLSIFSTNAISAGSGTIGLFPRTARLNHGCLSSFNSVYHWREEEGVLVVHALRFINEGEELLVAYRNTRIPRSQRQSYLRDTYHFDCDCATCSLPPALSQASEDRVAKINDNYAKFSTWGEGKISGSEAREIAMEIRRLMDEEGYLSEQGQLASDMAQVCAAHSNSESTASWARLAFKHFSIEIGADSVQAKLMQRLMASPTSHQGWGIRKREEVGGPTTSTT